MAGDTADLVILGGGLAGGLTALALAKTRPDITVIVIADEPVAVDPSQTDASAAWIATLFNSDVPRDGRWLVDPLVIARWRRYDVRFPRFQRLIGTAVQALSGASLRDALIAALPAGAIVHAGVATASATSVTLSDGRVIVAGAVIDARGVDSLPAMAGGWHRIAAMTVRLSVPHGILHPRMIDARVSQRDGARFIRCLPLSPDILYIADECYSDAPEIDIPIVRQRIDEYCRLHNWPITEILDEVHAARPVVAVGRFADLPAGAGVGVGVGAGGDAPIRIGQGAGLFHPTTGDDLALAVWTALHIAELPDLSAAALAVAVQRWARAHWSASAFYRRLARLLFGAASPKRRYKLLERLYRAPDAVIERFYAERLGWPDRFRLAIGNVPVPIRRGIASWWGGGLPLAPLQTGLAANGLGIAGHGI